MTLIHDHFATYNEIQCSRWLGILFDWNWFTWLTVCAKVNGECQEYYETCVNTKTRMIYKRNRFSGSHRSHSLFLFGSPPRYGSLMCAYMFFSDFRCFFWCIFLDFVMNFKALYRVCSSFIACRYAWTLISVTSLQFDIKCKNVNSLLPTNVAHFVCWLKIIIEIPKVRIHITISTSKTLEITMKMSLFEKISRYLDLIKHCVRYAFWYEICEW